MLRILKNTPTKIKSKNTYYYAITACVYRVGKKWELLDVHQYICIHMLYVTPLCFKYTFPLMLLYTMQLAQQQKTKLKNR
jgi:hypothetical protein